MRKDLVGLSIVFFLFTSTTLLGQALTIGPNFSGSPNSSDQAVGPTRTDIDLVNPATATGSISSVHLYWSSSGCTNAVKVKFFHRSGNSLTMTAERGPFTPSSDFTVTMTPAVPVQQGDLIGVARVANCGNPGSFFGFPSAGYVAYPSDVTGTVDLTAGTRAASPLALGGTGTATEALKGVITVVGSTGAGSGVGFKTGLQILNGSPSGTLTGRLVFHPAGASGGASDPSVSYSLAAGQLLAYPDIMATLGRTGLGSIDVIVPTGQATPVTATRVFYDGGAAGTSALTEDLIDPSSSTTRRVIVAGFTAFLFTPFDISRTRYNIGVRTLASGASMTVTLKDASGVTIRTVTKSYLPNWFEQTDSTSFFGAPIGSGQTIQISVSDGSAIVYGSTTDNTTNDPSVQFADAVFGTA